MGSNPSQGRDIRAFAVQSPHNLCFVRLGRTGATAATPGTPADANPSFLSPSGTPRSPHTAIDSVSVCEGSIAGLTCVACAGGRVFGYDASGLLSVDVTSGTLSHVPVALVANQRDTATAAATVSLPQSFAAANTWRSLFTSDVCCMFAVPSAVITDAARAALGASSDSDADDHRLFSIFAGDTCGRIVHALWCEPDGSSAPEAALSTPAECRVLAQLSFPPAGITVDTNLGFLYFSDPQGASVHCIDLCYVSKSGRFKVCVWVV